MANRKIGLLCILICILIPLACLGQGKIVRRATPVTTTKPAKPKPVKQSKPKTNPTRTVLYTCGVNDDFHCHEYYSNMKVVGNKFACMTRNNRTGELTFILNGTPVITAHWVRVHWIDLTSKNKCIYYYQKDTYEHYLVVEDQKYGPYEWIDYDLESCSYFDSGRPNYWLMYNKNSFSFGRMGKFYRHDNDGSIYELSEGDEYEVNPQFKTKDGTHTARFSNNLRMLTLDGYNYVMPLDVDAKSVKLWYFIITDLGDCIFALSFAVPNGRDALYLYINNKNRTLEKIDDGKDFDPSSRSVKLTTPPLPAQCSQQMASIERWQDKHWINGINISLKDKTNKHFFTANWNYEYVMIDDKKIGKHTPINAFYDEVNNAFGWVTIEGKQLVLYSYKL